MSRQPIGEVIQEFADGGNYIKNKLDSAARELLNAEYAKQESAKKEKAAGSAVAVDEKDVAFIVSEFEITRSQAEESLRSSNGDLTKALENLVALPSK
ncbi:hypothetical protein [Phaffia rhodozyma]|uniref:Nascent polypeptide-associated complex subunit alpha-like UBA domain-containing protein n=1 Tax=Phaffia rhodozyma TaxID=264483 RepID=A0A0F7SSZ1_PHARH|nr:hypothetical protein [Phaffia rhodozyma]